MFVHDLAEHYQAPKWRMQILNPDKLFWFGEVGVGSLWDLKQAVRTVSEHDWNMAVDGQHHIAEWIEKVVEYERLAELLRQEKTRWGLLIQLERQLLRTLYLPHYVAKHWLAQSQTPFVLADGRQVWNLYELKEALEHGDRASYALHLERVPNDFGNWALLSLGDFELAKLLEQRHSIEQVRMLLSDHLAQLEEAAAIVD